MSVHVCNSDVDLAIQSADELVSLLIEKPDALICIAAGDTQKKMFEVLESYSNKKLIDFSQVRVIELDEWIGLGEEDEGSCQHFLTHYFYDKVGIQRKQIKRFDAKSKNLDEECQKACDYLDVNGPIDLLILGVGMNGHIGFNEPYSSQSQRANYRKLDEMSVAVGQKYFKVFKSLEKGITLGLKDLLSAKQVIIQVTGEHKAPIVKLFMESEISNVYPVTLFREKQGTKFLIDKYAASLL